ncbi:MAG: hypothetical protein R3F54_14005 [Alphaproteobacteria bacterium]
MLDFLEYEEKVGRLWHRLVGEAASFSHFDDAAVGFDEVKGGLPVFFRALGGDAGLELVAGGARDSGHRLNWRQRIGMERERLDRAERHETRILLPEQIACFPERELNRQLYLWLAAFFALGGGAPAGVDLRSDLVRLHDARHTTARVLASLPGLMSTYVDLAAWTLRLRPVRRLPKAEAEVERAVRILLGEAPGGDDGGLMSRIESKALDLSGIETPRGYHPFLAVPLWGDSLEPRADRSTSPSSPETDAGGAREDSAKRKRAARQQPDDVEKSDPLTLVNKGDFLLLAAEMVKVGRAEDEETPEAAKKALGDMDQLTLGDSDEKISAPLKLDLDLAARAVDEGRGAGPVTLPEWHYKKGVYLPDHCSIDARPAEEEGERWTPDREARLRIRHVRRQFEAFRPRREALRRQLDGGELDMDALVRAQTDRQATGRRYGQNLPGRPQSGARSRCGGAGRRLALDRRLGR